MEETASELKNISYELFITAVSILAVVNIFIKFIAQDKTIDTVIFVMDLLLSLVFLVDFLYRLFSSNSKSKYISRQFGWADLLSASPQPLFKILRLFRIFHSLRLIKKYGTVRTIRDFVSNRGGSALLTVLFFIILVLEFGSTAILATERTNPNANIITASDAIWWVYVTITTVGYGDRFPVTNTGRILAVFITTLGVSLFSILTGFLAKAFLSQKGQAENASTHIKPEEIKIILDDIQRTLKEQEKLQVEMKARLSRIEKP